MCEFRRNGHEVRQVRVALENIIDVRCLIHAACRSREGELLLGLIRPNCVYSFPGGATPIFKLVNAEIRGEEFAHLWQNYLK